MDKVRVGVVGVGWVAQVFHLSILTKLEEVEVSAICDRDKSCASNVADRFGIPHYYTNFEEMLRDEDIQAVIVSTPVEAIYNSAIKGKEVFFK